MNLPVESTPESNLRTPLSTTWAPLWSTNYESQPSVSMVMAMWLESGTRRDMCVLLYEANELRGQELKRKLETHYDERIPPKRFRGRLEALVSGGHVERRTEGIEDVYALTDPGEESLETHYDWVCERLTP